jgi:hypothetical protein
LKDPFGDLLAVDERSVARTAVTQQITAVFLRDFRVLARDVRADDLQIGGGSAADHEKRSIEHDDSSSLRVSHV